MTHISVSITRASSDTSPTPPPARVVGWRGLHVAEGGRVPVPLGSPGVIPPFNPTVALTMRESIQLMSYDLMAHFHPAVRAERWRWRLCHGDAVAMNNGNGYDADPDYVPRRDYVNRIDLDSPYWPRYHKMQITFEGSLRTGRLDGKVIWCEPGVDAIDARGFVYEPGTPEAAATLAEIIERRWYSIAVGETATGSYRMKDHWDGLYGPGVIVFPFILDRPVSYEARFFSAWDETFAPDPTTIYHPKATLTKTLDEPEDEDALPADLVALFRRLKNLESWAYSKGYRR